METDFAVFEAVKQSPWPHRAALLVLSNHSPLPPEDLLRCVSVDQALKTGEPGG